MYTLFGFLVITIAYPIIVEQKYISYNPYLLPMVFMAALLVLLIAFLHSDFSYRRFGRRVITKGVIVTLAAFMGVGALVGVVFGAGYYGLLHFSKSHIANLLSAEKMSKPPSVLPPPPGGVELSPPKPRPARGPSSPPQRADTSPTGSRMSDSDRTALTNALLEFSKALDDANELWGQANQEGARTTQAWRDGSIVQDYQRHKDALIQISQSTKQFAASFPRIRNKWRLYHEEVDFIFGDNPDNEGPNAIINAVEAYSNYIDRWLNIEHREQRAVLDLFFEGPEKDFQTYMKTFSKWWQESNSRLEKVKRSIQ